jgi:SAM-dependent methyltransferase
MHTPPADALTPSPAPAATGRSRASLLRAYMQAYWLRPENAMWMTLRSEALATSGLPAPAIDLGCGDGIFMFLHCGGRLDPDFDVFAAVSRLDDVARNHADMFDHVDEDYAPETVRRPARSIDCGTDLKSSMLAKAQRLGLYGRFVLHDNNNPLPFDNESFRSVYCNAAYWVENIDDFLRELRRIVRPDGRVVLHVKSDAMRDYTLERHRDALGDRFLDLIGRGRMDCWPSLASRSVWERRFAAAGLHIESATPFATRTHAHIWDIGLRPLAPMLVKMANALPPPDRAAIKRDWVATLMELALPLCDAGLNLSGSDETEPAEWQYVLKTLAG